MSNEAKIKITADSSSAIQNIEKLFSAILKIGEDAKLSSEQMAALASVLNATKEVFVALDGVIQSNTENIKTNKEENKKLTDEEKKAEQQKERLKQAIQNLAAGMGGSIGQFVSFIYQLKEASKEGSKTEVALLAVTGVLGVIGKAWNKVTQELHDSAAEGKKTSQAIVGAGELVDDKIGDLIGVLIDDFAPAIAAIAKVTGVLIDKFVTLAKENGALKGSSVLLLEAFKALILTFRSLSNSVQLFGYNYELVMYLMGKRSEDQWAKTNLLAKKSNESWDSMSATINKVIADINSGADMSGLIDEVSKAGKTSVKLMEELNERLASDEINSHTERLVEIKKFQEEYAADLERMPKTAKRIGDMIRSENKASQDEINRDAKEAATERKKIEADRLRDAQEGLQAEMDLRLSMTDGSKQAELDLLMQYQDTFNSLHEDDLNAQMSYQQKINEVAKQTNTERIEQQQQVEERLLEDKEKRKEVEIKLEQEKNEAIQAAVEERIALIEFEGGTEEQISRKKIALYQSVSKAAGASAALRKKVELDLLTEQKKINTAHEKQYADYAKKISSTVSGALNQMIFEHKSFNEVVGGLIKEFAMKAVATFVEMAATAIAKDVATAGSAVVASGIKKSAQSATVASGIASWTSLLGPIGPAVYSTYLSIYKGLITGGEATLGHEEGGPLGRVPGFGRSDSFGFTDKANSQEFILNERGRKAFGDEALSYANETGANPFNSMGGSGDPDRVLGTLKIVVELRNMLTPADDVARAVAPAISKALSQHVIFNNGTLIASKTK